MRHEKACDVITSLRQDVNKKHFCEGQEKISKRYIYLN